MPLNEIFWLRVKKMLELQGRDEAYLREKVPRDKNTYTNWFLRHQLKKIKDLEDIADALGVPASLLIATDDKPQPGVERLRLPIRGSARRTSLELEWDETALVVRAGRPV
jgi:hypothetical protein